MAISGNLGRKISVVDTVLSSQQQDIYATTSLDEHCIECENQRDQNCSIDLMQSYLPRRLKFVKGFSYKNNNTTEVKREPKEEAKNSRKGSQRRTEDEELKKEEEAPVFLVPLVNIILHSFFSNVEVCINNQQLCDTNGRFESKCYNFNKYKKVVSDYKEVLCCGWYYFEYFRDEIVEAPLSEPFFTRATITLVRPDEVTLYG